LKHLAVISLHADPATPSGAGEGGGTHAYVRELMMGLARSGSHVTVLTRWANPNLHANEYPCANIRIIRLRIGAVAPVDKRELDSLHHVSLAEARRALLDSAPDLIHSIYWNSGRVALDLGRILHCPFVHTVISNGWRRRNAGAQDQPLERIEVENRVFAGAFAIFCVSSEERNDLIDHYGVTPDKTFIVGRPVSATFRSPCRDEWGRPASDPYDF
jgi:D-inositol-3-phosphate glycosyltransferase